MGLIAGKWKGKLENCDTCLCMCQVHLKVRIGKLKFNDVGEKISMTSKVKVTKV